VQYLQDVNNHIRILRRLGFPDRDAVISTYQEHYEICQSILAADLPEACRLIRTHIHASQAKGREVTLAQLEIHRRRAIVEGR
jgi:DNA-binding GntR family transcriptional regulator